MELLIEGFASYAASMQPGFFQLPGKDDVGRSGPEAASRRVHPAGRSRQDKMSHADDRLDWPGFQAWPDATPPQTRGDRAIVAAPVDPEDFARSEARQAAASHWTTLVASPLARLLSKRPPAHRTTLMSTELDALDDRTLRDIGIARHELDRLAKRAGHTG